MQQISKLAFQLEVPAVGIDTSSIKHLESFHEETLKNAGLKGYTGEFGDGIEITNNKFQTEKELTDCYYFAPYNQYLQNTSLKNVLGLDGSNFFKTIIQVCTLLQYNYKSTIRQYRHMSSSGETHVFFPFINYIGQKVIGMIGVYNGADTFKSSLNLEESDYANAKVSEYWGNPEKGLLLVLPQNNNALFLKNTDVEITKDYRELPIKEFMREIKSISETSEGNEDLYFTKEKIIRERIHIELSYEKKIDHPNRPVNFVHPDGSFTFDFESSKFQ
jgi:hypothetical protein